KTNAACTAVFLVLTQLLFTVLILEHNSLLRPIHYAIGLLARITIRPRPEYCQALRNDLYSSHGRNTIQCSAFVCSGKLSPERQRHDEENTHSLVSSCPDLINRDTSSITDASAPRCAGGQSASRRTDLAAQRAELDAGLARDRRLNRDESREKLHSIQRCSPIKAAPLALWSARQRRRFGLFITKSPQPQAIRADPK